MNPSVTEMLRLKWFLGQILAILSLWTVAALDMARGPVWLGVFILTLVVTAYPYLPAKIPSHARKFVAPALILVFLGDLLLNGREIIPPMVRLLLILLAIRIVTLRRNREDLQLVLLTMFLSVVSGVFTLSMLFAVQAFLFAMTSIGLLFLVNLLESSGEPEETDADWKAFSWPEFWRFLRSSANFRMFRSLVVLLLLLLATTAILFVSIPRVHLDQAIPFLRLQKQGKSGFSDVVRLGDVTNIQEDDSVALWIDVPSIDAVPSNPYWRMLILDRYDQGAFINSLFYSPNGSRSLPNVHSIKPSFPESWFEGPNPSAGEWTFYMEEGVSQYLPMLGPFRELTFQGRQPLQQNLEVLVFRMRESSASVFSYKVRDFVVRPSIPASSLDLPLIVPTEPTESFEGMLQYPFTTLEVPIESEEQVYLRSLLKDILKEGGESPNEIAGEIMNYLQANHQYSLSPGGYGLGDPIVQWLRDGRPGHCEFFAGAFTLLARTAGVPTRMVVGFSGGTWNSYEDFFVVRNRNAHAWCEIFDGKDWVRYDPTPGGAGGFGAAMANQGRGDFIHESDFQAWIDSLRVMWFRRVINFDDSSQENMIEDLAVGFREAGNFVRGFVVAIFEVLAEWGKAIFQTLRESLLAALAAIALVILITILCRGSGLLWMDWGRDGISDPVRRKAGRELQRLSDLVVEGHEREEVRDQLKSELLAVRFGPSPEFQRAIRLFREAKRFRKGKVISRSGKT